MSRETLLDDAIAKAKDAGDWQMVEWLRDARGAEKASRWYTSKIHELEAENKKLRELARCLFYAVEPSQRELLAFNAAELMRDE